MAKNKDGFKTSSQKTATYGNKEGGNKYCQIKLDDKFKIINKPKANVKTDKPFDSHLNNRNA